MSTEKDSSRRKQREQGKKQLLNTLTLGITPILKQLQTDDHSLQMPELALHCAQFFHSISRYCVGFYKNHKHEQELRKVKLIKKQEKDKHEKGNRGRGRRENRHALDNPSAPTLEPPKKPLTAYIIYFQDKKHNFVERYPSLNLSELTKLIAKEWKELSQTEKQVFLLRASEDRKRYEEQMTEFKRLYGKNYDSSIAESFEEKDERPIEEAQLEAIINAAEDNPILMEEPAEGVIYKTNEQLNQEEDSPSDEADVQGQEEEAQQPEENGVMQEELSSSEEGANQNEDERNGEENSEEEEESEMAEEAHNEKSSSK